MSKTLENLKSAFAGESEARNKYTFFADVARKEGYHYIAKIFEETAENEKYHAMEEIKLLLGDRSTLDNLKEAVGGENYEAEDMYPRFAKEADLEGNQVAAILFAQIAKIEKHHRDRFQKLLEMVEKQKVFIGMNRLNGNAASVVTSTRVPNLLRDAHTVSIQKNISNPLAWMYKGGNDG